MRKDVDRVRVKLAQTRLGVRIGSAHGRSFGLAIVERIAS